MYLLRPIRFFAKALTSELAPRQLAVGFALGMVIGLVPKGNLTTIVLVAILCAIRVNLGVGLLSAFVFSWAGILTDPLTHHIGLFLLTHDSLRPLWSYLYDLPVAPWTDFNNTIVLGSLVLGLALAYPAYRFSLPLFGRYTPMMSAKLQRFKVLRFLWSAEWAGKLGKA